MKNYFYEIHRWLVPSKLKEFVKGRGNITERIAKGSFWILVGSIFSRGMGAIISIVLARLLGQTIYGQFGIIQSTIIMFATFAGFGLGLTSTKYVAELRESDPQLAGNIITSTNMIAFTLGIIFTALFLLLAPIIATRVLNAPYLTNEIRIGSIMLLFSSINGAQTGVLIGFEGFREISQISITVSLIYFPIQIATTYLWGLDGAIIGLGANYFSQYIFNYKALKAISKKYNIKFKYFAKSIKNVSYLWKFSLPAVLSGVLVNPVMWYCNTLLVRNINGFKEMAIYNAASQWQNVILFVPMAISQIALPFFSTEKSNKINYINMIKSMILVNVVVGLILAGMFSLFSLQIMKLYGEGFSSGRIVLILLSITSVLVAANNIIGQVIASLGKMWIGFLLNLVWAVCLVFLVRFFVGNGAGALGLAQALFIAYSLHTMLVSSVSFWSAKNNFQIT